MCRFEERPRSAISALARALEIPPQSFLYQSENYIGDPHEAHINEGLNLLDEHTGAMWSETRRPFRPLAVPPADQQRDMRELGILPRDFADQEREYYSDAVVDYRLARWRVADYRREMDDAEMAQLEEYARRSDGRSGDRNDASNNANSDSESPEPWQDFYEPYPEWPSFDHRSYAPSSPPWDIPTAEEDGAAEPYPESLSFDYPPSSPTWDLPAAAEDRVTEPRTNRRSLSAPPLSIQPVFPFNWSSPDISSANLRPDTRPLGDLPLDERLATFLPGAYHDLLASNEDVSEGSAEGRARQEINGYDSEGKEMVFIFEEE